MINKSRFRITHDKKLLRKIGKQWVTVSAMTLALLGGGTLATSVVTHAASTNPAVKAQNTNSVKKQLNSNLDKAYQATQSASGSSVASSNTDANDTKANQPSAKGIMKTASLLHANMLNNAQKPNTTPSSASDESGVASQSASSTSSKASSSNDNMNTVTLGTPVQQQRGWNFVQNGIRNNDFDNTKPSATSSASSATQPASSSGSSVAPSGSVSVSAKPSFNSAYQSYMAQMSGIDSKVASANSGNIQSDKKNIKKPLLKDNIQPDYFSGKVTKTGNDDGLNYKVYANGGVEFTDGTANSDLSDFGEYTTNADVYNAKAIKFDNGINTSKVTNMSNMFCYNEDLHSLTLSNFDTSNVTNMSGMIEGEGALQSLTLPSSFNTSKVTDMSDMFNSDSSLQLLKLPNSFDTSNVTNMSGMFHDDNFQSLTLPSSFNTSNVTNMSDMFGGNYALQSLTLPNSFDTINVTDMSDMFSGDSSLQSLKLPNSFDTSNVTDAHYMFSHDTGLRSLTIQSPSTIVNSDSWSMYKETGTNDPNGNPYTLSTPNDFFKGNVGTFVTTPNPASINVSIDYFDPNNKMLGTKSLTDNNHNDALMFVNPSWSNTDTSKIKNLANLQDSINQNVPSGYQQNAKITSFGNNQWGPFIDVTVQPVQINYEVDFDDNTNDNSVGSKSITAPEGATYNIVSDATAKKNGNPQSDITIPDGYEATSNTPKTITIQSGHVSYIAVAKTNPASNNNSADIPVQGHKITFKGNIVLHFQSNSNHDIKDIYIPYNVTTKVDENIQDLLSKGDPTAVVPTDYLNRVIQKFNTSNYSYAHQVNGKTDDGTYYNNVWISPNMAGADDTDAKDKVSGQYDSKNDTYTNPDFQLDFNALYPGDKPSDTNSPSNTKNPASPLSPTNKRHDAATTPTGKGQKPNSWNPNHSDSPFNPSNSDSPYSPTSPLNPDNPNSPLNPKNDGGNTNPNDPNSQYNPNNPKSILNPKNPNSPLNPSKPNSPLNPNNNSYQPNDNKNNPWNPNTPDSPLNPNNPNSPLSTKNSANPSSTTNPGNPNNPLSPSNEKKRGNDKKPASKGHTDPSDVPSAPSDTTKPSDSDVNVNGKDNGKHNPSVPGHVVNPNKPVDNNKTKGGQPNPDYNPIVPDKTSDTKNGTNTTPNQPDDNKDASGKSTDIPDTPDDADDTFYVTVNDFNNNHLVRSYQKRVLEGNVGTNFTLNPSDYTTEGYSMDSADKPYTGYVSANGLTTNDKTTPQSSIVWNYNADSHTVPVHYINQQGHDLTPSATITGNTSDVITPSDELPAGYHVNPSDKPYKFGPNASDITFNVSGNQLKDSAKATIHLVFDHDGQKYSSRDVTVSLKGKHIGDSDVIVYPFQYQPSNDTYHEVPFPENPADIKLDAGNFDSNGDYTPANTFTYDATTAPSLVVRYVNIDPNAQSVGKGNDSKGRPIIESDTYSAKQLESAPYNLDWVVGNKFTFGLVGSKNNNTVNLIKAPAGYDLVNNASGFDYQNGIETMTLTNGSTYKGHPAMLLMVGLGAMPIHHHVQPNKPAHHDSGKVTPVTPAKPSSASAKPSSSASAVPSSASVAPSSKANSASSNVAPSITSSVSPSSSVTPSSQSVAPVVTPSSKASSVSVSAKPNVASKSKAAVPNYAANPVAHHHSHKATNGNAHLTHLVREATAKLSTVKSNVAKRNVLKGQLNNKAKLTTNAKATANEPTMGKSVATNDANVQDNNVAPSSVSAKSVSEPSAPKSSVANQSTATTYTNHKKLPQTGEANAHAGVLALIAMAAGAILAGFGKVFDRKHNE